MKVIFYLESFVAGGAQRVTATLSNYLAARGWEVVIVTLREPACDFYVLDSRIRRVALLLQSSSTSLIDGIAANVRRIQSLRRVIKEEKPLVAIAMMDTANVLLALARFGIRRTAFVGSERIYPPFSGMPAHWKLIRNWAYRYLDALVAQTTTTADWLRRNTRARNVRVIANPIVLPLERHAPVIEVNIAPAMRMLLTVGRLVPQKNVRGLIAAFARIASEVGNWILVVVGEGPDRETLEREIKFRSLTSRVLLVGEAGNAGDWYERADLFAMASDFEGFPNTLLEALSHGVPAVACDCDSGPRELIRDGVDGYLVPRADVDALADALRRLMLDDSLRAAFAQRAAEARNRFDVSKIACQWMSLFDELIVEHGVGKR
jgi:glycosyltransferase involved in cell wall biosynthesis